MTEKKTAIHFIVLYVLVIVLAFSVFSGVWSESQSSIVVQSLNQNNLISNDNTIIPFEGGEWACYQEVCTEFAPAGEQWAQENCGSVTLEDGSTQDVCQLVVDGQQQLVPRSAINLSAIQRCVQTACQIEVWARGLNLTNTAELQ